MGDTRKRLVLLCIQHMENRTDQECVAGFGPMIATIIRTLWVNQDVRDVLHITNLMRTQPNFQQRIVPGGAGTRGIEIDGSAEGVAPPGGDLPIRPFDVVHDDASRVREECGDDDTNPFTRAGGCEEQHMFRAVMA